MVKEKIQKKIVAGTLTFVVVVSLYAYFVLVRNGSSYPEFCIEFQVVSH